MFIHVALIIGPYIYTMARPEKSLKYRFIPSKNEQGEPIKSNSSYNRLETEVKIFVVFVFSLEIVYWIDSVSNAIT